MRIRLRFTGRHIQIKTNRSYCSRILEFIAQGGTVANFINSSVKFPIAFKAVRHISTTSGGPSTTNTYKHYTKINELSNTAFSANSDDALVRKLYWIAVGN